jgi:hypothetical protein
MSANNESSLRFKILRNAETSETDDINEALAITLKGFITLEMNTRATLQSEGEVTISEHISESGDRLNATITDTLFEEAYKARDAGRRLYGCDGEIEFDDGQPVIKVIDGWNVECWVWVDAASARVDRFDDEDEDQVEMSYIAAAQHRDVSFDDSAKASLGDDPGAYVSGWVHVSDYDAALGREELEDDAE